MKITYHEDQKLNYKLNSKWKRKHAWFVIMMIIVIWFSISIYLYRLNQSRFYNFGLTRNETDQTNDKVN